MAYLAEEQGYREDSETLLHFKKKLIEIYTGAAK